MVYSKKGQVTVFLILAVVIVIIGGYFFISRSPDITKRFESEIIKKEKIPSEFSPVNKYISECLYATAEEALIKIGESGGYVNVDDNLDSIKDAYASATPSGKQKIIYWRYFDGDSIVSKAPPLEEKNNPNSIESQISDYVEKELDSCLNNFEQFAGKGFFFSAGTKKVETTITLDEVFVELEFPVKAVKAGEAVDMDKFIAKLDVNLRNIYQLAVALTDRENKINDFELYTNTITSLLSGDNPKPPPKGKKYIPGAPKFWATSEVEDKVKPYINSYFQRFRVVKETDNVKDPYPEGYLIRLDDVSSLLDNLDVKVKANYLDRQNFEFDICGQEICRTTSCSGLPIIPCQEIRANYNIKFPVLIEITDKDALSQKSYTFYFLLQSNIKNNKPFVADALSFGDSLPSSSQFCDPDTWNSGAKTISVTDSISGFAIENSDVYLTGTREDCLVGLTDSEGQLTSKLPEGIAGGELVAKRDEYISASIPYFPQNNENNRLTISLQPLQQKTISVKKKMFKKNADGNGWYFDSNPVNLNKNEEALVTLTKSDSGAPHTVFFEFAGEDDSVTAELSNGKYNADIQLFVNDIVIIPKSKEGILFWGYEIPEIIFGVKPENFLHIAKLDAVQQGSNDYKIKCIDKAKAEEESYDLDKWTSLSVVFDSTQPQLPDKLVIAPMAASQFNSKDAYLAVETNKEAECRYKKDPNKGLIEPNEPIAENNKKKGYELYTQFDTNGFVHIYSDKLENQNHNYDVICKEPNSDLWILSNDISFNVNAIYSAPHEAIGSNLYDKDYEPPKDPEPTEPLTISLASPEQFGFSEAFIAVETNQKTTCMYASGKNPGNSGFKLMGIPKDSKFLEGGFKGELDFESIEKADEIILLVLDMGLDDIPQNKRTLKDLEHWSRYEDIIREKSKLFEEIYR